MKTRNKKEYIIESFNGKRLASFGLIAAAAMLATSCISVPQKLTFDESWPAEETAEVFFGEGLHVLTLNGVDVDEAWYGTTWRSNESATVILPAGETEVEYDLISSEGGIGYYIRTYSAEGLKLIYTFEAGKSYDLEFESRGGFAGIGSKHGIALYEGREEIEFWELEFGLW
jgi:hypothetical protein